MLWTAYQWWRFVSWFGMRVARAGQIGIRVARYSFDRRDEIITRAQNDLRDGKTPFWPMRKGTY